MKKVLSYFLLSSLFLFYSCSKKNEDSSTCCDFEISYEKECVLLGSWQLVGYVEGNSGLEYCLNEYDMGIVFISDSTFAAQDYCNSIEGKYEIISEQELLTSDLWITSMYCEDEGPEDLENRFFHDVKYAKYFYIDGNKLTITSISDTEWVYKNIE